MTKILNTIATTKPGVIAFRKAKKNSDNKKAKEANKAKERR